MSDCCASSCTPNTTPKKHTCVSCGNDYLEVPYSTILHHIKMPWQTSLKEQGYYFCANPECDVVYFGLDNSTIKKTELRTPVGIKETSDEALICYCFDVNRAAAQSNKDAKAFVVEQTKVSKPGNDGRVEFPNPCNYLLCHQHRF